MPNGTSGGVGGSEVQTRSLPDLNSASTIIMKKTKDLQAMPLESPLKNSVNDLNSSDLVVFLFLLLAAIAADAVQHK